MSFKAPCDCTAVAGLKAYFPNEQGVATSQVFLFTDAHGNDLTGIGHLFTTGTIVKVILHVDEGKAYIQNADTNKYLEGKFEEKADLVDGKVPAEQLPAMNYAPADHVNDTVKHISAAEREAWDAKAPASHTHDDRYYTESEVNDLLAKRAPAYTYGTDDLTAGSSPLASGTLHFVYE